MIWRCLFFSIPLLQCLSVQAAPGAAEVDEATLLKACAVGDTTKCLRLGERQERRGNRFRARELFSDACTHESAAACLRFGRSQDADGLEEFAGPAFHEACRLGRTEACHRRDTKPDNPASNRLAGWVLSELFKKSKCTIANPSFDLLVEWGELKIAKSCEWTSGDLKVSMGYTTWTNIFLSPQEFEGSLKGMIRLYSIDGAVTGRMVNILGYQGPTAGTDHSFNGATTVYKEKAARDEDELFGPPYDCRIEDVRNASGLAMRLGTCSRPHEQGASKALGLLDFEAMVSVWNRDRSRGLSGRLSLEGVGLKESNKFLKVWIDGIRPIERLKRGKPAND